MRSFESVPTYQLKERVVVHLKRLQFKINWNMKGRPKRSSLFHEKNHFLITFFFSAFVQTNAELELPAGSRCLWATSSNAKSLKAATDSIFEAANGWAQSGGGDKDPNSTVATAKCVAILRRLWEEAVGSGEAQEKLDEEETLALRESLPFAAKKIVAFSVDHLTTLSADGRIQTDLSALLANALKFSNDEWDSSLVISFNMPILELPPDHLLLDSAPNFGPLISRWDLDKFKNCWNKSFRTSKNLTLLYLQFLSLLISQRDLSCPRSGSLSNNRWSGVYGYEDGQSCLYSHFETHFSLACNVDFSVELER